MSYDGKTNTKSLFSFLFLSIFLIFGGSADDKLMRNECHSSEFPTTCLQCLQSDPTSSVMADRLGIATIIVHCLDSQLHLLINNITSVTKGGGEGEGEAVKKAVKECKTGLSGTSSRMLSEAKKALKNGAYDKASRSVRFALQDPLTCASNLHDALKSEIKSQITLLLFHHFTLYQQLSNAAMRIIDRL